MRVLLWVGLGRADVVEGRSDKNKIKQFMQTTTKQKAWLKDVSSMASMLILQASDKKVDANIAG